MAKYSDEFKLRVVKAYLEGSVGYSLLAKRFNMPSPSPILRWVRAYKEFGEEGIRKKTTKEVYSVHFKLNVLEFMKKSGASFQDTAIEFNMNNPNLIVDWHGKFSKKGVEGLTKKRRDGLLCLKSGKQNHQNQKTNYPVKNYWSVKMSFFA